MNIKNCLSLVTSLFICIAAIPHGSARSADETKSPIEWDGTADTTWYDGEEKEQHISSPSELAGLAVLVNGGRNMKDQTIILDNDISLKNRPWTPISGFSGIFDGNNHTISELNITSAIDDTTTMRSFGFFAYANTVQNLTIKDISFNIEKDDNVFYIGGVVGDGTSIKDCIVSGSIECGITKGNIIVGGIAGRAGEVMRCKSNVVINAQSDNSTNWIGGICGCVGNGEINECCNYGKISYNGESQNVGIAGIVGSIGLSSKSSVSVLNCYNRADIDSSLDSYGIVGSISIYDNNNYYYNISNVYNTGKCSYGIYKSHSYLGEFSNMYYSSTAATKGTDSTKDLTTPKPIDNMKKEAFATSLGSSFVYLENELPILKWEAKDMPISTATTSTTTTTTSKPTTTTTTTTTSTTTTTTTKTTTTTTTTSTTSTTTTTAPKASLSFFCEKELTKGEKYTINVKGDKLQFTSDNKKVAVVSPTGIIEAMSSGTTVVSFTDSNNDIVHIKVTVSDFKQPKVFGDINTDNTIDGRDATLLLTYYTKTSTGYTGSLQDFINGTNGSKTASDTSTTNDLASNAETTETIIHAKRQEGVTGYYDADGEWKFYPEYGD